MRRRWEVGACGRDVGGRVGCGGEKERGICRAGVGVVSWAITLVESRMSLGEGDGQCVSPFAGSPSLRATVRDFV